MTANSHAIVKTFCDLCGVKSQRIVRGNSDILYTRHLKMLSPSPSRKSTNENWVALTFCCIPFGPWKPILLTLNLSTSQRTTSTENSVLMENSTWIGSRWTFESSLKRFLRLTLNLYSPTLTIFRFQYNVIFRTLLSAQNLPEKVKSKSEHWHFLTITTAFCARIHICVYNSAFDLSIQPLFLIRFLQHTLVFWFYRIQSISTW